MDRVEDLAEQLKNSFPVYTFFIYRGLFEKYIAVEIHGKVAFTIWVDNDSEQKELLDETYFSRPNCWKRRFKTRLFHWTKQKYPWSRGYLRIMMEKLETNLPERQVVRKRLEGFLQSRHIA